MIGKVIKILSEKTLRWWHGEFYKNPPDAKLIYIGCVFSPSAILARRVVSFIKREYKFLISVLVAVTGIILTLLV